MEKNATGFDIPDMSMKMKNLINSLNRRILNRLDATITFAKLGKEVMLKIVGKFLVELKEMVKDKNVNIEITDEALDWLVEKGFNKKMGARSLTKIN